ncbi:hypothetical protein KIN20_035546 [Parelaphostrongylus tenuis]|uniref:Lipocalin/cytosolic fatty-acid binding domain-containing protein n=1 Tax=Parelaphostrongylus tenuis TaxID=148309 RepID=A0AAD5RBA6_PARTN|nr:hypothetical protein KIN20_035546 [Parelaphostrongylus tenuis]
MEGDKWIWIATSTFKNTTLKFRLNEEFEEITPDGRAVKSLIKLVSGKFLHIQTPIKLLDKAVAAAEGVAGRGRAGTIGNFFSASKETPDRTTD